MPNILIKLILPLLAVLVGYGIFNQMNQKQKVKIGDKVPDFSLYDQDGKLISVEDIIGKTNLVIYFYPKDDTPGCTTEACAFRDEFEKFKNLNARIIGISSDDITSHKAFSEKYDLTFTLLSDPDNKVRTLFGVPKSLMGILPGRTTYIVDKKGIVREIYNNQFKAANHIQVALKKLNEIEN